MSDIQSGDPTLQSIWIACPSCRQDLRARPDHLGRRVRCKRCEHSFRARSKDDRAANELAPALAHRATTFIEVPCPNCERGLRLRTKHLGQRVGCKHCKHAFDPSSRIHECHDRPSDGSLRPDEITPTASRPAGPGQAPAPPEGPPHARGRMGHGPGQPAASGRPGPRPRGRRKGARIAKLAAACLVAGGAVYFKGASLAGFARLPMLLPPAGHATRPYDRGMDQGRSVAPSPTARPAVRTDDRGSIVCSGRVEPVQGEVEVSSQIEGQLDEVRVAEGDVVEEGHVLAVLEGPRETAELSVAEANVATARSRLERVEAGNGQEEIRQALHEVKAQDAMLEFEKVQLGRFSRLLQRRTLSQEEYDRQARKVEQLQRQRDGLKEHYEAVRRGPLRQEVDVARAEVALAEKRLHRAKVEHDLRIIRAPMAGTILEVYRHAGDSVITDQPTPILRMADTSRLRIRLEVDEANVARLRAGLQGTFQIRGASADVGRLAITTIIPMFGPKRLFNPDTSARYDTRTLAVFCEPLDAEVPLYPGQRITASLSNAPRMADTP